MLPQKANQMMKIQLHAALQNKHMVWMCSQRSRKWWALRINKIPEWLQPWMSIWIFCFTFMYPVSLWELWMYIYIYIKSLATMMNTSNIRSQASNVNEHELTLGNLFLIYYLHSFMALVFGSRENKYMIMFPMIKYL